MLRDPEEYIERIYSTRIEKLLKEVKKKFPEDYRFFVKVVESLLMYLRCILSLS